jgi:phage terminase large subunit-like protein
LRRAWRRRVSAPGLIPRECFVDKPSLARGVTDAYDTIQVRHESGGISVGAVQILRAGPGQVPGRDARFLWFDEEPDLSIYSEGLTRITATGGMVYMTFTPLKGMSDVVARFSRPRTRIAPSSR